MRSAVAVEKNICCDFFESGEYIKKFVRDRQKNRLKAGPCLKFRQVFLHSLPR